MKRKIIEKMIKWKDQKNNVPLLLSGMKGVGKTYLALEFSKLFYEGQIYINLETDAESRSLFERYDASCGTSMVDILASFYQVTNEFFENVILILDEVMVLKNPLLAINALVKDEECPSLIMISSNSADFKLSSPFEIISVYPLEFDEFLSASGSEWYTEVIQGHYLTNKKIPDIVHQEMINMFQDYLVIGGMPAAVNEYLRTESLNNIADIHKNIISSFKNNFTEYRTDGEALKLNQILDIVPDQLVKDNKKFQFSYIRKGATFNIYKEAFEYLLNNQYVLQSNKIDIEIDNNKRKIVERPGQFRIYSADIGILNTMIYSRNVYDESGKNKILQTLIENYIVQELYIKEHIPYFWESGSQARVDLVIENNDGIIPIDIKINENTRSKSLSVFKGQYETPYSLRVSAKNFENVGNIKNIPYYALFCL